MSPRDTVHRTADRADHAERDSLAVLELPYLPQSVNRLQHEPGVRATHILLRWAVGR